jgi:hypothetical protein
MVELETLLQLHQVKETMVEVVALGEASFLAVVVVVVLVPLEGRTLI